MQVINCRNITSKQHLNDKLLTAEHFFDLLLQCNPPWYHSNSMNEDFWNGGKTAQSNES